MGTESVSGACTRPSPFVHETDTCMCVCPIHQSRLVSISRGFTLARVK